MSTMEDYNSQEFVSKFITTPVINGSLDSFTNSNFLDGESQKALPIDMQFNDGHKLAIVLYTILMIVSAIGNVSVFYSLIRLCRKGRLSRINLFLLHMNIADLIVTFVMMPLEIAWNITVSWEAGDWMCRIMSFLRVFGLYLSGFVLVCISLDRYISVMKPVGARDSPNRGIIMLIIAWIASVMCSLPQSFIFHVETHPHFTWYEQCITFNSFTLPWMELTYNFCSFFFMYGFPMMMIIFCYTCILCKMYCASSQITGSHSRPQMSALGRAKGRTLKMSIVIVTAFFFCWTPYNVMSFWYWFDKESAQQVDQRIQKGFFLFACTNSCVNPLIYGLFHFRPKSNSRSIKIRLQRRSQVETEV